MEDNKNKTKVDLMYDDLYEQGYLEKDRDTFNQFFFAPGEQGYKNRKALYDDLHEQGYLESPTYEDFAKGIGLHSVQQGAAQDGAQPQQVGQQAVQGNGRRDMVESLDKYYEGLQAQNTPQAPAVTPTPASSPSFGGGGAASSWKDGQSIKTSGGRRQRKATQKDLYVDDKGNPALGASEEDSRDIERSGLYYPLMRNDSINLAGTEAFRKGWLVQPQLDKNVRFAEARAAGYKAQGEKFKDLSDEQLVQAMREEEKKLDGSTSPESLQASMNVRYIETLMAAREWGLGDVVNFNATPYMVDYHQVKRQYNKNGLVDKYEKNMLTRRDDNPLLIRGWELIEDQYLKDEAAGNLRDASYYRNLPFYDPKFAEEFGAYITARIKVTGERWNDAVKDAIDDFEAAAAEGRVGQRHSEEYLGSANRGQVDDMLDKVNAALKKRTGELDDKFMNKSWFQRMGESSLDPENPSSRYLTDPDASNLIWAGRALQDAKKIIAAFDANRLDDGLTGFFKGAGRGLVDSLGDLSTWDGGISDLLSAQRLNAAVDKFKRGKPLSASEKALLDATSLKLATAEIFKEVGRGYKAGTVTGESLPFMVEMALNPIAKSGNKIASGLAKYANKYLGKYLKKMVSKLGRSSAGRMATRILGSGLAKNAGRVTARVVGDIGAAGGMAATSGLGHSAASAIGYHTGDVQYQQGAGGKTHFSGVTGGDDWVTSTLKGFGSTTIENASEMWGEYFKPITNFLGSVSGKALEKMHLGAITRWLNDVNSTEMARLMSDFRKQTRWDGNIAEYFEEVAGNIANALTVGDMNFSLHDKDGNISLHERNSVFNVDDNLDTFLGVSLMSGAMGSANIVGYRTPKYRAKQDVKRYGDMARGIFGARGNDWSTIESLIQDNSEDGRKQFVADLMQSGKYSQREKQAALQYAGAVYKSMGMDLGESKQKRSAGEQEAEEAYGRGYDMANLETIAETSSAYNQLRSQMEREYGTELMERMDSEPGLVYGWVRAGAVSEEDAKKVLDYLNAKMAYEGAVDRLNDDDSAAKAAAESHIDDQVYTEENGGDGQIHPVTLKGREGDHYVVSGNVVTDNDGNVDVDASDNEIVVVDSNGKRKMTTAKDIAQVGDTIDPNAAKAQAVASIESVSAQTSGGLDTGANQVEGDETLDDTDLDSDEVAAPDGATQQDASSIQAPLPVTEYNQDDLVTVEVDGQQVDGIVTNGLDDNGNVTLYLEEPINGRQNVQLTPEQLNQVAVSYTSRDGETISRGETPQEPQQPQPQQQQTPTQEPASVESGEVTQTPTAPAQEQTPVSGESEEPLQQPAANGELDVQTGETPQTPNAPVAEAPQQAPAQPSLPVGEDGNADFSNATPQEAHDYIYNDPELDEDEADEVVRSYAAGAQSRLDEAQAALKQAEAVPAPKMEDYRSGNAPDVAGYKRAKRERNETIAQAQAAVDAAQREVDLWNGVQAQHMMARAAANVAANREENPAAPSALAPVSGESENNAPAPSQTTPAQGQQATESTQEPSAPQPNEGNGPMASTSPATGVGTQPQEEDNEGDGEDQDPGDSGESASPEASGVEARELTPDERIERARMEALENRAEELAESCGLPVQVARSLDDLSDSHRRQVEKQHAEGKYVNGFYDPMTKQIVLFLPDIAKNGGLRRLERTFLHEGVAHGGLRALFENAQNGIQTFDELCDQVWEMMPVAAQASMMNYIGVQKPEDMTQEKKRIAADEYMAHLAEWGVEPSVKTRIINAIKNALRKIGVKMKLSNSDIVSLLAASRRHLNEMDKVRDSLEDHGIATSDSGDALMFAVSDILEGDERKKAIKELMDVTGRTEATVKKWLKAEESLAKVILDNDNVELLDLQVDESVPSIWNNSDYPQGTVEFSNICRKRLPFTVIYQRLQEEFPNTVFDASTLEDIRNTMKENGVDVACGLCFVEDRRQLLGEIGEGFIKMVEGEEADLNENQQKALDKLRESGDNYVPNLYELLTLDGMKKLRKEHPAVAKAFVEFNNARGMQAGRLFQAYSAYHREILNWNKAKVKKVNDAGGLRIFSFSDFEAHHLIDLVQVLTDCAAKGVKVQGYTKVPEFAKAVKETKMKLNRSLIAKGKGYVDADYVPKEGEAVSPNVIDGKRLLLDTVEGINVNHPDFFDSTDNNNVGNILVGINDEQIRLAMADTFVDYIIPFHSGLSEAIRAKKGIGDWVNYKLSQLEKKRNDKGKLVNADKHGVNIYTDVLPRGEELIGKPIRNARDFQNAFFKACEEKGWVPRFSKFINKNKKGQYVYTPGYEKLLLDFKLFDKNGRLLPQEAVVPLFDNEFNKKILDDYVKGEKAKTPYDDLYEKIKERLGLPNGTVIKSQEGVGSGVMFSTSLVDESSTLEETAEKSSETTENGENMLMSTSPAEVSEEEREVLMGIHNITAEKLRSAIGLGGLANPSMAVVDTTKGLLNNFGEISLIPGRDLIDKRKGRNAGTFTADAYTPRFPTVHRRLGKGGEKKLSQWIKSLGMRPEMEYNTTEQFNDWVNGFDIQDNALVYPFLHEKGLSTAVDQEDHNKVSAPFREIVGRYHGDIVAMMDAFETNEEVRQEITDIIIDDIVKQEAQREEGESWKEYRDRRRKWRQLVNEAYLDFAGFVDHGIARATLEKECSRYVEASRFNPEATRQAASIYIDKNGMRSEYTQWREQRFAELGVEEQMYAGSDSQGRSKYKPITLESVSKAMKKQGLAGGESSFFSQGPGGVRARLTPRLTSLNQIRAERGRIQSGIDSILEDYSEELGSTISNLFGGDREAAADVLTSADMKAKAKELGFEIGDATVQYLQDFKNRIIELPTEYFETKFERPVMLNEFEAAVVPNDVDSGIREALEAEGLDVREYDPELAGDRERVTMEAAQDSGNVLFSTGWHGSGSEFDRFDHSHMGEGEGAQAYGWGTYITSVEGIGRSYATESAKKNPTYYWKGQKIDRASINPLSMAYDVVEREGTIKKAIALVDRFLDNPDAHENWAEVKEILKQSKKSDFTIKPARYLYEVEIPDNNGENYISWNETLPKKHRRRIANVVRELPDDLLQRDTHGPNWLRGGFEQLANTIEREQYAGKEITERLRDALGNSRAVSEIFSKAGFVGTEYPAQYLSGGRKDGAKNYVIYNEDDIEIKDRIRFSTSDVNEAMPRNTEQEPEVDGGLRFSVREKPEPKKTMPVYKLMRLGDDGKLYPLFIDGTEPIELGVWYDADSPNMDMLVDLPIGVHLIDTDNGTSMTMEEYVKQNNIKLKKGQKYPPKEVIESTPNGQRWVYIEPTERGQRRFGGESRRYWNLGINGSGSVSTFSMRPGWHAGSLPTMRQIGKSRVKGGPNTFRDDRFVWVEGLISADIDYNEEAQGNPDNDIPTHIPTDGFYMKATNANAKASQADRVGWYISGAFMPVKIMSDSEARQVIDEWNADPKHADLQVEYDFPRESGKVFNAETMQLEDEANVSFSTSEANERRKTIMNPRAYIPKVRGGWTEKKILRYLKGTSTPSGVKLASRAISEFDSVEELKDHMFYHGTVFGPSNLKPSITMSDRELERVGGGGYGDKYWGISVSKSKRTSSLFSGTSPNVKIYPIILRKGANVIERPDFSDAWDVGEHIVELWDQGIDAVWIGEGKQGGGEQELLVLNPNAIVNIGTADFYKVYNLGTAKNPLNIADDNAVAKMYDTARKFAAARMPSGRPSKPTKPLSLFGSYPKEPTSISRYKYVEGEGLRRLTDEEYEAEVKRAQDQYKAEVKQREEDQAAYDAAMEEYERKLEEYNNSEEMRKYNELERQAYNDVRFSTSAAVDALKDDERVWNDLLGKVFSGVSNETRRGIVEDAMRNRGNDFGAATEAWLGGLADDGKFADVDRRDWGRVKLALHQALMDNGVDVSEPLTDGESRYVLWKAGQVEDGVFSMAEDVVMRDRLLNGARAPQYTDSADVRFSTSESEEDGIRFSVTPRDRAIARDQYERWMKSGRMQWLESMQDSMLGLKKLMQAIMGNAWTKVEDVAMYENPYIAENLMSSVTAAQQQAFYTEFMKPLLEEVGKLCKGGKKAREKAREGLTNYLMAKHGLERNQVLADRDAQETAQAGGNYQDAYAENRERDYSGLTALTGEDDVHAAEAKAQQMVDDYEAQHDTTELWSRINAATQVTLEKQYKSGMLSYAEYQRISGMFDYYVPLRGWEETTSDEVYGYLTSKAGPFLGGGIVKHAEGRTSKADDPIATIAQMGDDSIRTGNRNLMKQRFLNFVQNHPSDAVSVSDLWLQYDAVTDEWVPVFADIDPNDSPEVVEQKLQAFEQQMQQLASQEPTKYKHGREAANIPYRVIPGMEKEHQVLVKRNGQTWVLTINGNPRAAQALNGLTNPDVPMEGAWASAIRGAEWVNRTLSALYTTLSPAFIVSNFLRDSGYSNTMVWVRESPNYALRFNANYLKLNPATLRWLLGRWENGTLDESKPLQKHFKEFMLNGGETGFAMVKDIDKYKKDLLNEVKNMNSKNFVRKGMKIVGSQYELLGRSIENCARFAAYVTSREMGRDVKRSAYDAKEISVNFNKKGSGGKSLGKVGQTKTGNVGAFVSGMARSLYTFWNAGVQGMTNAGRAVKRHPVKAALMGAGPLYAAGFLAPILAQMMGAGGDGDDDKNAYYNLPEYVRRSNLCIWLGDAWLTIPLPIEFRSIYGMGELTYGVISGNERYSDDELAMQIAGQFSQLLPIDMLEGGGGFHPFIPTLFKPIVEAEQNKSWSGLPIYRDSEWNKDEPEYTKAFSNANEWIVSGAEWLNAKTGGDEFKKGWIDLNPAKIEYMLKGYLGGIYTTIDEVRRAAETALGERDFEWRNIPLANRVIKQGDERTESKKLREEYFNYKKDYEETKRLINKYRNAEDTDLFDYAKKLDLLNNSKEYGRYLIFEKYSTMLEAYQKAKKGASGEVLKKIEEDEKVLMRQLVDEMHAFEDGKLTVGDRPKLSKKDRSEDYGYMYNNLRTYVDINEDALLDSGLKRAKASGDKGMAAALSSIKRSIGEMKKGLGRGKDENVMNSIRRMREGVLRSFGLLDGSEVDPDVPETEEQEEDWGDEGQDNVPEPDDLEFESFE